MLRRVVSAVALLGALAGGGAAGYALRRAEDAPLVLPRPERTAAVDRAWQAYEAGRLGEVAEVLRDAPPGPERDLLLAAAADDPAALEDVARRHVGTNAGALAEILLADRATDEAGRRARRAAFAERYPRSWWNGAPSARSPR